ncbi:MAG: class I SAM-dependent methyltransferase [Desulfobacteraceae bacterium]|nr:MAG: class I SAM-dependent methyltransferase [Desulfobacteraceae bacterium]
MTVFNEYARYYDLFYGDKDYAAEAEYIHQCIRAHHRSGWSVLNLGCGSGNHDRHLTDKGYRLTGVDRSEPMLNLARKKTLGDSDLEYIQGDARSIRLNKTFDIVISLFHVINYQTTHPDLNAFCATARLHLKPGGLFLFDCWYGPAVLTDLPVPRMKKAEDESIQVTRLARPLLYPNENRVDVTYCFTVEEKESDRVRDFTETHCMRYLFLPEIKMFLTQNELKPITAAEWLTGKEPGLNTWNLLCGAEG